MDDSLFSFLFIEICEVRLEKNRYWKAFVQASFLVGVFLICLHLEYFLSFWICYLNCLIMLKEKFSFYVYIYSFLMFLYLYGLFDVFVFICIIITLVEQLFSLVIYS